jgi:ribonuclease Z
MNLLGRNQGLKVYGPAPLKVILETFFQLSDTHISFNYEFIPVNTKEKTLLFEDAGMRLWAFPLKHRIETYGYSIEEKKIRLKVNKKKAEAANLLAAHYKLLSQGIDFELMDGTKIVHTDFTFPLEPNRMYSYCSDTAPFEGLSSFIDGTTTLYHEATFLEAEKERAIQTFHSTAKDGAEMAKALGVKKLLLGHLSSRYPDGQKHTEEAKTVFHESDTVEDGQTYEII